MNGWPRYLGFALPLSIILSPALRDAHPIPTRECVLCKKGAREAFTRGDGSQVCTDCIADTTFTLRRMKHERRALDWPPEVVAAEPHKQEPLDPWWERQFP